MIQVTQPTLPSLKKFNLYLKKIWQSKQITNNGFFHQKFEKNLCDYLNIDNCSLVANGTLALILGIKCLNLKGEVITSPYSFVATTHAIYWNGLKPVFCDIEEKTCNIDPDKIESLITPRTSAILPIHVYGNPCDVKKIEKISKEYDLKVIYDAAHSFNIKINDESILNFGDLSILSFHATKVFNTIEGGATFTKDKKIKERIDTLVNFGFIDNKNDAIAGLNAKMNELQAAYGILELEIVENEIKKRKVIANIYRKNLEHIKGIKIINEIKGVTYNYSYFPIFIDKEHYGKSRDEVYELLLKNNIYTRKYFYPLISNFSVYKELISASPRNLPVAEKISNQVLCLPIYGNLKEHEYKKIINLLR